MKKVSWRHLATAGKICFLACEFKKEEIMSLKMSEITHPLFGEELPLSSIHH